MKLTRMEHSHPLSRKSTGLWELKAALSGNHVLDAWTPMGKKIVYPVKDIQGQKRCSMSPQSRVSVPTGIIFEFDASEWRVVVTSNEDLARESSVVLITGITHASTSKEIFVELTNISDTIFNITDGEPVAQLKFERVEDPKF